MADPIIATEVRDRGFGNGQFNAYPRSFETLNGMGAVRFFSVITRHEKDVLTALGLPNLLDAHPDLPATPGLNIPVVTRREIDKVGGDLWLVTVNYEPASPGVFDPDDEAEDGSAYTELVPSLDQATIRQDVISEQPIPETSVEASKLEVVVTFYRETVLPTIEAWADITNKINTNTVEFPPFRGSNERLTAGPDQLLCRVLEGPEPIGRGLQKMRISFAYAPTDAFKLRWYQEDEQGVPVTGTQSDIYERVSFDLGAMWA